jgi:Rad52/22 family double-strand break repair protein
MQGGQSVTKTTLADALPELRRPFTPNAIKFKPQATSERDGKMYGLVSYYLDARLAAARLTHTVADWSDEYDVLIRHPEAVRVGLPVECRLTVLGVTRRDIGQIVPGEMDEKAWKSAYSDAFKRAAVKFEIGAYLYGGPQVWAECKVGRNGKAQGFAAEGVTKARQAYAAWIASKPMKELFGDPLDHGDVGDEHEAEEGSGAGRQPDANAQPAPDKPAVTDNGPRFAAPAGVAGAANVAEAGRITEAQTKLIDVVASKLKKAEVLTDEALLSMAGKPIAELSKSEASALITKLKNLEKNAEAAA